MNTTISTSNTQFKKIEKKEIKSKQTKLSSTKNLNQTDTIVTKSATKNYKSKKYYKTPAIQEDNLLTQNKDSTNLLENGLHAVPLSLIEEIKNN
ncbi:19819_t:CDS:2 [Gigaspora margarita]|uniref:19819_t:CDS:1 n=1 Tax=Gigaspora margarita TaxID=4874 RepID=A0ABN7UDV1_GIGMA|nr:19819_t:CDS:2 [Gigaspora margarita]